MKDNQKKLSEVIAEFLTTAEAFDFRHVDTQKHSCCEKDHDCLETRRAVLVTNLSWRDKPMRAQWKELGGIGILESEQEIKEKSVSTGATSLSARGHHSRAVCWCGTRSLGSGGHALGA